MDQALNHSTSNIQRRYRHLFTLPARNRTIAYASVIALATTTTARMALKTSPIELLFYLFVTEIALLCSIEIDRIVLRRRTKLATYRRLTSVAIVSDSLWFVLSLVGVAVLLITGNDSKLLSLVILGAFFAIAVRALLIGSLFYTHAWQGVPLAFVQPAILILPTIYSPELFTSKGLLRTFDPASAVIGGLIAIAAIEVYISIINRAALNENFKPIELLQAFLSAWAAEDATNLERLLEVVSKESVVKSQMISFESTRSPVSKSALVVVPGAHPGPFYPIGSSNLPSDIFQKLSSDTRVPMVVHSISDHDLNLPSKKQVERYVSSLKSADSIVETGKGMSSPVVKKIGKVTVNGICFGSAALLAITQSPHGMEDFPIDVKTEIEFYSSKMGFKNLLLIDTHNSEGEKPGVKECADAVSAAREVLNSLKTANIHSFNFGVAHSSEIMQTIEKDIGPAGVGLLLFEIPETKESFSLVIVDANNSIIGFREKVIEQFARDTSSKILEICTSDTHVTAARTSEAKGYFALGDLIDQRKFSEILKSLYSRAKSSLSSGSFSSSIVSSDVKTIGGEVLNNFSGLLDTASSVARNGAEVLAVLAIVVTIAIALI
ncbi:MAG: DUF2070 family protein [Nitrososphaerales archaeon]